MTNLPHVRPGRLLTAWFLAALLWAPATALAEDLEPGVVAVVGGRRLTFDGFCVAAEQQARADLKRQRSGPRGILEQLIEELLVRQECRRLGITVTQADVDKLWREWDTKLRTRSGGERTLRETIKEQGTTEREFVEQIWHLLRKERIAEHPRYLGKTLPTHEHSRLRQVGIVIATVRKNSDVKYGVELVDHVESGRGPDDLPQGHVASVNGEPITALGFGRSLILRLPGDKVREYLDRECKTALMTMEGVKLSDAELDQEIQHLEQLWPLERELQREEVWRTVTFKDRFETQFNMTLADVKKSRYSRGLLGLVRSARAGISEAEIQAEFERSRNTRYGEHILVTDVQITFAQRKSLLGDTGLRSFREALEIARGVARQQQTGVPFEKIVADINNKRDRTLRAQRVRLYNTDADRVLFEAAARLRDGDVSSPFETLSEVHVMRREGLRPARTLEEVRPHVRELLARRKAREWIEERVRDPKYVRVAWPLKERGEAPGTPR